MGKNKDANKPYAKSSIYALLRSHFIIYLFISKPNWGELEDRNGNKLTIPPTWYLGSAIDSDRIVDHLIKSKTLTAHQFAISHILRYMEQNNLKMVDDYYFDIYVLDFTDFFWHFSRVESGFWLNRRALMGYKNALEHYVKTHMRNFFVDGKTPLLRFLKPDEMIVDGFPTIDRFADVWGTSDDEYLKYSIENINSTADLKQKEKKAVAFLRKLCYSCRKDIIDDALTPISLEELQERQRQRSKMRKELVDVDTINSNKLLP